MERQVYGGPYSFISIPHWKTCQTYDWYFHTDDARFDSGNYFPFGTGAPECFAKINAKYRNKLLTLEEQLKANTDKETGKALLHEKRTIIRTINQYIQKFTKTLSQ